MNTIRITSGEYRNRTIKTPKKGTHPMGARERLALFNMLAGDLPGARVLDAYAGSGALGIEALSRGAGEVVLVEKSPKAGQIIRENLHTIGIKAEVIMQDVVNFTTSELFDIILADPPYDDFDIAGVEHLVGCLKEDGTLVLSHPGEAPVLMGLTLEKSRSYAGATISVYRKD